MVVRPVAGILHFVVFRLKVINIRIEIIIDGIFGTYFSFMGGFIIY